MDKEAPKVQLYAYGNGRSFFLVDNVQLQVQHLPNGYPDPDNIRCCCKHCSINSVKNPTCKRKKVLKHYFEVIKKRV